MRLGELVDTGALISEVIRTGCGLKPQTNSSPQPIPTTPVSPTTPVTPVQQPSPTGNPRPRPVPPQEPQQETCDTKYPQLPKCLVLSARGYNCSEAGAFSELSASWMEPVVPLNPLPARLNPPANWAAVCLPGGSPLHISTQFVPRRKGPVYPGTIGCCTCCEEDPPHKEERCTIVNRDHRSYSGFCGFH